MPRHSEPKRLASGNFPIRSALGDGVEDITQAAGQSSKSERLSRLKAMLDMKDGDEHFNVGKTSVGPVNDMYLAIKSMSIFRNRSPVPLVTNTQINLK